MKIKIKNKVISNKTSPLIIAEVSANHCGSKKLFLDHIKKAARNGADLIKIQTYEAKDMTIKSNSKIFKIKSGLWKNKYVWDLYQKAQTPFSWHADAFRLAKKLKVILFSSPFSKRAVDLLEKFNVPVYKIASFEITDVQLIKYISKTRKPIIMSTGMASIEEITNAIKVINKYHSKIVLLHCVSSYPTNEKDANIRTILKLKKIFKNCLVGLSDHTDDIDSSLASIPLGACVIEKHFKVNDKIKSFDSKFSINSDQLKNLKNRSIRIFNSLGISKIKTFKTEKISQKLRRSIFASQDIMSGQKISSKNIITLRPLVGIDAKFYYKILGKRVKRKILKNTPLFFKNLI
tara:strand:- start:1167 stop:2210 length:1044 start_codon:yes stop_codon:yes gene_type:complete